MANPLLSDRDVTFQLYEVHGALDLCDLPYFADHGRETFDPFLASARKLAREVLFPAYRPMDQEPPRLVDGRVSVHPAMREIWPRLVELGLTCATRPAEVGGQQMPIIVTQMGAAYLMAANAAAMGYLGLTAGAGHLIEEFGNEWVRQTFLPRMYGGSWTGTMALTEPQAGSSLADVRTRARPTASGHYLLDGNKVFISGGDQDFTENIVHLALARIEGAPAGVKGISLFAVPRLRPGPDGLADNDCHSAGVFHKLGWRGLPSIALNFGERGDCRGWLVGTAHQVRAHARAGAAAVCPRPAQSTDNHRPARRRAPHAAAAEGDRGGGALAARRLCAPRGPGCALGERGGPEPLRDPPRPAHAGGEDLPRREGVRGERPRRAGARRLRVHQRVPPRGVDAGPEAEHAPRGDQRHPGARPPRPQDTGDRRRLVARARRAGDGRLRTPRRRRGGERAAPARAGDHRRDHRAPRLARRSRRDDAELVRLHGAVLDRGRRLAVAAPGSRGARGPAPRSRLVGLLPGQARGGPLLVRHRGAAHRSALRAVPLCGRLVRDDTTRVLLGALVCLNQG